MTTPPADRKHYESLNELVGANLKTLRGDTTQAQLASAVSALMNAKFTEYTVARIETKARPVTWPELYAISEALDVPVLDLVLPAEWDSLLPFGMDIQLQKDGADAGTTGTGVTRQQMFERASGLPYEMLAKREYLDELLRRADHYGDRLARVEEMISGFNQRGSFTATRIQEGEEGS